MRRAVAHRKAALVSLSRASRKLWRTHMYCIASYFVRLILFIKCISSSLTSPIFFFIHNFLPPKHYHHYSRYRRFGLSMLLEPSLNYIYVCGYVYVCPQAQWSALHRSVLPSLLKSFSRTSKRLEGTHMHIRE